ncbi:MAG: HDOD domain-containing protein [Phycisphaerae bacterium]
MDVDTQCVGQLPPRERVEVILSQLDQLPTLSTVAARLLAAITSDETSARDVVEIIESDAALTALTLRLIRRADLGVRGEAMTVARAVTLLGFSAVRNAVLSVQLYEAFSRPDENHRAAVTRKALWKHSLAVACVAEMIGEHIGGPGVSGEAFVCGLLHDIGKIALDACLPKSYARVVERVERRRVCICDVEREVFGLDHTVAGKRLVTRWRLPQAIIDCAWLHHQGPDALPPSVICGQLVRIVHLADNMVRQSGIGYSGYQYISDVDGLGGELGMDASALADTLDRVPARMEPFCELVGLDDVSDEAESAASLVTANRQLSQLNAKLAEANKRLGLRSACFAALEQFTKGLSERDGIGDVCVAAARSLRELVGVDRAVAFFGEALDRCIHVAYASSRDQGQAVSVIDLGESHGTAGSALMPSIPPARALAPAPDGCDVIWQRCAGSNPRDPLWILPLVAGDTVTGGVLVAAGDEAVRRFRPAAAECDALSAAMGLAMTSAKARVESERMNEELLDLNRRLGAAQKELVRARSISMIAAMAAGAAHELNNPLSVISGRAQMELAKCDNADSARALKIIVDQTQRATQIVMDLMHVAKPEPPHPTDRSVGAVLESLCQHWRAGSSLREDQVTLSVADGEATVYADPDQLDEILNEVMANAIEATRPETACLHVNSPSRVSDETVRIVVADNGVGMTRDVLEHALDPFFSSRPAGRGRGLGLSRAYRLAEMNGGHLSLESTPNAGTTVTIEFPARAPTS